ncbi:MAG: large-conductance mechanosensitive channel protein MscL [Ignavibacteria bacterium]|jgi:large conductance mechanosensitive channel|nr:large-conductance mechanosensitive channel protein MscL [Ignavibacteria bacterium]
MSLIKEFKEFTMRGNVLDLAIGVIIGGAFGKIVSSLVDKVIMPPIGIILGKVNFADLKFVLQPAVMQGEKVIEPEVALGYGAFLQTIIDFVIIAFCIFMVIKIYQAAVKKSEEAPPPPAPPTKEEVLLTEIRDLLKQSKDIVK